MQKRGDRNSRPTNRGVVVVAVFIAGIAAAAGGTGALLAGSPSEFTLDRSDNGLSHARRLLEEGELSEAKAIFTAELKRDPKSVEALRGLALCARDEGDDESALHYLQRLTSLSPKDRLAWRQLALAASRLGRDMEALSAAQTALSLSPNGDHTMSDLMTRIFASDGVLTGDPLKPGSGNSWPPESAHAGRNALTFDPLEDSSRPEAPDPLRDLPGARKGK